MPAQTIKLETPYGSFKTRTVRPVHTALVYLPTDEHKAHVSWHESLPLASKYFDALPEHWNGRRVAFFDVATGRELFAKVVDVKIRYEIELYYEGAWHKHYRYTELAPARRRVRKARAYGQRQRIIDLETGLEVR